MAARPRLRARALLAPLFVLFTVPPVFAQWSADPASNLVIAARSNEQAQPKMVPTSDGGFYVSWFDNADGGYDVYLQRLNAAGEAQWVQNGIRIADRQFSSTQDYGLSIDSEGNALLAFRYPGESGPVRIVAAKVSPAGTLMWDEPGITVSSEGESVNSPRIVGTEDGSSVIAWSGDGVLRAQKLDADGEPLWNDGITLTAPSGMFLIADLDADAQGNAILSWQAQLTFQNRQYWAQKLAASDGASLWPADHVKVMDNSVGIMQLGNFPAFVNDGDGGAVFGWYHVSGVAGVVRVQHVLADGNLKYPQNGVTVSTDTSRNRYGPATSYDAANDDIYVIWRETDSLQNQIGLYAQRIDSEGNRAFGSEGRLLLPLSSTDKTQLNALPMPDGALFAWAEGTAPSPMPIRVTRLDAKGDYVWPDEVVTIKTAPTDGSRLTSALSTEGYAAFAWQDNGMSFTGDIHAQNIQPDGSLGIVGNDDVIFENGFESTP